MSYTYTVDIGDGVKTIYPFSFAGQDEGYLSVSNVQVFVAGTSVPFTIPSNDPNKVYLTSAPPVGAEVLIRRIMPKDVPFSDFSRGNPFSQDTLNDTNLQMLYVIQEILDGFLPDGFYFKGDLNMGGHKIINMAPGDKSGDAINWDQFQVEVERNDEQDQRLEAIESSLVANVGIRTVPYYYIATGGEVRWQVPVPFQSALLFINGVFQNQNLGAFSISDNGFNFAEPLVQGDEVYALLGSGAAAPDDYATHEEVASMIQVTEDSITPEMHGAKGDGVVLDDDKIQAAIEYAKANGKLRVSGMGKYRVSKPILLDNLGQGFRLDLQTIIVDTSFPETSDWKTANGVIEVGGLSNGSMVGIDVRVGYCHGNNKATLYKLKGFGAGGSHFWYGRVQNCVGIFDATQSDKANSNSNFVEGLYGLNGTYGIRCKRNGSFVVEGTKLRLGFLTGMKYGGIQFFNGAQYFSINSTGLDFCGRNLTQLTVNSLPPVAVRETMLTNDATGNTFEVLDVYQQTEGVYSILVIEPVSSENGSVNFSSGQTVTVGGIQYTISSVTTSVTGQAYFDFIHGFQGAPFSRGYAQFDYLSRAVGGNFNGTAMFWYNSFQEVNHAINNVWIRQQGNRVSFVDRWTGTVLMAVDTTGGKNATFPGGIVTQGTSTFGGAIYVGGNRVFGSENNVNLPQGSTVNIRTLTWTTDGTVTTTKKSYNLTVSGPNGLTGVGGECTIKVSPSGAEVINGNLVNGITIGVSGFTVTAVQGSQANMNVTFMFERKM
ncbi:hypothetical protein 6939_0058 [Klebsiella phage 6939]|uniref:Bacteriophage T7 tail fibre protein-like N-terminal domain-containing protein n=1 Tax=Klebsiella phage 6939 TaxID=2912295 RepID=A0A9E7M6U6_9CAUD|nr:hypothetical protein 6939_0058 [Klebsiella phage 6939]